MATARVLLTLTAPSVSQEIIYEKPRLSHHSRIGISETYGRNRTLNLFTRRHTSIGHPAQSYPLRTTSRQAIPISARATEQKKVAKLFVKKRQSVPLPTFSDSEETPQHLRVFLNQPEGRQSMLNTKALQKYEDMGENKFRCYLPKMEFLNFEVAPVIDLFVAASEHDCQVELLSCKFEGSDLLQNQNERFSASLRNHLSWRTHQDEDLLDVNLELNVSLEVYTLPFTLLPVTAVETPGNLIMQGLVDKLLPLFLDNMFSDYREWAAAYPKTRNLNGSILTSVNSGVSDTSCATPPQQSNKELKKS